MEKKISSRVANNGCMLSWRKKGGMPGAGDRRGQGGELQGSS